MATEIRKPKRRYEEYEDKQYEERRKKDERVEYHCWNDTCSKVWKDKRYPENTYCCPFCGSYKITFKP